MNVFQVCWTSFHDAALLDAAGSQSDLEIIKSQVLAGEAELWQCESETGGGFVVTRLDPPDELCVVLGEGKGASDFIPIFIEYAKSRGLTIRTHVKRRGLIKMWARHGVHFDEYVLRG